MNLDRKLLLTGACLFAALGTFAACDGSDSDADAVTQAPPPPPPPEPVRVGTLIQTSGADPRVAFPQEKAPTDAQLARAVIRLADAIARGDADALRPQLTEDAAATLAELESSGAWAESTASIEQVRVVDLGPEQVTLAVQKPGSAYPLRWAVHTGSGSIRFGGAPVDDVVLQRASQFDAGVPERSSAQAAIPVAAQTAPAASNTESPESDEPEQLYPENDPSIIRTPAGPIPNPLHNRPGGG